MTVDFETVYSPLVAKRSRNRTTQSFYSFDVPSDVVQHKNPLNLAGGTPDEGFFPVESIHLNLINEPFQHLSYSEKTPLKNKFDINTEEQVHKLNEEFVNHTYRYSTDDKVIDIADGFQYSWTNGFPQVRNFAKELIQKAHTPAYDDWDLIATNGSGDSLYKVSDLLVEDGGTVLVEAFTFTVFNNTARSFNGTVVPVKLNIKPEDGEQGIDVEWLDDLLTNWDKSQYKHKPKPTALYTIPTGQNPTALSQSLETRKKILNLAEKHNFIIIEDDPYGYLVLPKYGTPSPYESPDYTVDQYLKSLTPSYLTIDTKGRVIRLETFSKLFAPGLRLGFIVANKYLLNRIFKHQEVSSRSPSGVSQLVFNNVIQQWGGVEGWIKWSQKIAKHYTRRRDLLLKTLYESESHKKGQFTVIEPDAGMFVILYINLESRFPDPKTWETVLIQLRFKAITNGVAIIFGNKMASDLSLDFTTKRSNFIRITTAAAHTNEQLVEAGERLTKTISDFFEELEAGKYDKLVKDAA